jgi:hypothetical protein
MARLTLDQVDQLMAGQPPGTTLEQALDVFEVFASGTLADEVYVLDDVSGKRIAIAPREFRDRHRPSQPGVPGAVEGRRPP